MLENYQLAILGKHESWHVQQLAAAAKRIGLAPLIVPFASLRASIQADHAALRAGGVDLLSIPACIVRGIPPGTLEQVVVRMDALHRLEASHVRLVNPPRAIETCVDKYLATARLQAARLPVPATFIAEDLTDGLESFAALGGDVIVKPIFGSEGRGMVRVADESLAYRTFRAIVQTGGILYVQQWIDNPGWDARLLMLDGVLLAAMRRWAVTDFRTNVSRGGRFEAFEPPAEWVDLARRSAAAVGAHFAGVDILPDRSGQPFVLEVNSVPGFAAISATTHVDIPAAVVRFATSSLPHVDR